MPLLPARGSWCAPPRGSRFGFAIVRGLGPRARYNFDKRGTMQLMAIILFIVMVIAAVALTVSEEMKYRRRRKLDIEHQQAQEQTRRAQQRQRLQKAA